jgi:ubiquinone/menaquinone biosynthesis C-methylase UbiE
MKRTDYSEVARKYDANEARLRIPEDEILARLLRSAPQRPILALDLGCGTGNYLAVQSRAFGADVRWHGLDASEAMLALARGKLADVELSLGRAEQLPYEAGRFDYVASNFAFHHFDDKSRALDEVRRVSRPGAWLRIMNIDPTRMSRWWVYELFPEARLEDQKRFWSPELLHYELEQRGYEVRVRVEYELSSIPLAQILADAERRDISELAILSDAQYGRGLARIRESFSKDPSATMTSDFALKTCIATIRDAG